MSKTDNKTLNALKETASAGLIMQNYCTAVAAQPLFLIPADLQSKLPDVNSYLKTAQENANKYTSTVQPQMIGVLADVSSFSIQFPKIADLVNKYLEAWSLGSEDNKAKALSTIKVMQALINDQITGVNTTYTGMDDVRSKILTDKSNFDASVASSSSLITGNQGELNAIRDQLNSIDGKIIGSSVGVALSGLAIAGGIFMICIGSIASFITAGTSTPLVVAGAALVCAGAGGETASSIVLANLLKEKGELLTRESMLNQYVSVLDGVKTNISLLSKSAESAIAGLNSMSNAWSLLSSDLSNVASCLESAQTFSDLPEIVQSFFASAQEEWAGVNQDINIIKEQLTGVKIQTIQPQTNGKLLRSSMVPFGQITPEAIHQILQSA